MGYYKNLTGKTLLILGGIRTECDIVLHAKKLGVHTIVVDFDEHSPAKEIADEAILLDATNVDGLEDLCKRKKVDGVLTGFVDILLPPYMEICQRMGFPCYVTEKMYLMSTDKDDFKRTCEKYNIPVPKTYYTGKSVYDAIEKVDNYPVFVKPLDASGSRGCSTCNCQTELIDSFNLAMNYSKNNVVVVEQMLFGMEFLLDYVGKDGEFRLLEMFDRYMSDDRDSARNYANVSVAPSHALDAFYKNLDGKIKNMFKQLGFRDGLIFLQGFSNGNQIVLYEMGSRLGGTFPDLEEACLNINSIDMLINYALTGEMIDDINELEMDCARFQRYGIVNNFLLKKCEDTIFHINGIEEIKSMPGFVRYIQQRKEGLHFTVDSIVDKPVVSVYFTANTIQELRERISFSNKVFSASNEDGESLIMRKINPSQIVI